MNPDARMSCDGDDDAYDAHDALPPQSTIGDSLVATPVDFNGDPTTPLPPDDGMVVFTLTMLGVAALVGVMVGFVMGRWL